MTLTAIAARVPTPQIRRRIWTRSYKDDERVVRLRSEVEAPFRVFRLVLYGSAVVGGGVGLLVNLTQIIGAVAARPGAPTVTEAVRNIGIDVAAVALFSYLSWNEWKARKRQIQRLLRESSLANLSVQTTTKKLLKVGDLRRAARVVVVAGDEAHIDRAMEAAERFRDQLSKAGVYIVQAPITGEERVREDGNVEEDKRWKGRAVRLDEWRAWFEEQMRESNVTLEAGLYVGLRMDGRVRASGKGIPPWFRIANELPPLEGIWSGFGDGFDGPVV